MHKWLLKILPVTSLQGLFDFKRKKKIEKLVRFRGIPRFDHRMFMLVCWEITVMPYHLFSIFGVRITICFVYLGSSVLSNIYERWGWGSHFYLEKTWNIVHHNFFFFPLFEGSSP